MSVGVQAFAISIKQKLEVEMNVNVIAYCDKAAAVVPYGVPV